MHSWHWPWGGPMAQPARLEPKKLPTTLHWDDFGISYAISWNLLAYLQQTSRGLPGFQELWCRVGHGPGDHNQETEGLQGGPLTVGPGMVRDFLEAIRRTVSAPPAPEPEPEPEPEPRRSQPPHHQGAAAAPRRCVLSCPAKFRARNWLPTQACCSTSLGEMPKEQKHFLEMKYDDEMAEQVARPQERTRTCMVKNSFSTRSVRSKLQNSCALNPNQTFRQSGRFYPKRGDELQGSRNESTAFGNRIPNIPQSDAISSILVT